jgi:hypothetical protein
MANQFTNEDAMHEADLQGHSIARAQEIARRVELCRATGDCRDLSILITECAACLNDDLAWGEVSDIVDA